MSNIIKLEDKDKLDILSLIASSNNNLRTAEDIAAELNILESRVIELLNDDEFYNLLSSHTLASLRLSYHKEGIIRLLEILRSSDNKESLAAFDRIGKLIGAVKERDNLSIRIGLEELLESREDKKEKNISSSLRTPESKDASSRTKSNTFKQCLNSTIDLNKKSGNIFEIEFEEELEVGTTEDYTWEEE